MEYKSENEVHPQSSEEIMFKYSPQDIAEILYKIAVDFPFIAKTKMNGLQVLNLRDDIQKGIYTNLVEHLKELVSILQSKIEILESEDNHKNID